MSHVRRRTPSSPSLTSGTDALFGLLHIHTHVVRAIDEGLERPHGTGLSGYELLARLARMHRDGAPVGHLAQHVLVSPSRVSRLTDQLVQRGWLRRNLSQQDNRLRLLQLTPSGRQALKTMETTLQNEIQHHLLEPLSTNQLETLTTIARALRAPLA